MIDHRLLRDFGLAEPSGAPHPSEYIASGEPTLRETLNDGLNPDWDGTYGRCQDCPPAGYPTDATRCAECPRRQK